MISRITKTGLDHFPGYTALVLIKKDDICLIAAGAKYKRFFSLPTEYEGKSILHGMTETEKAALCTSIFNDAQKRKEITYSRKALRKDRAVSWIKVRAAYLEDIGGFPVFFAMAEDITDSLMDRIQLEETAGSLERINRELKRQMDYQSLTNRNKLCETIANSAVNLTLRFLEGSTAGPIDYSRDNIYRCYIDNIFETNKDLKLLKYDVSAGRAIANQNTMNEFGIMETIGHMPHDLIKMGIVAQEFTNDYLNMFEDICRGCEGGKTVICKKNQTGGWNHYQLEYTTLLDKTGRPDYALIIYQDIEQQYKSGEAYSMLQELTDSKAENEYGVLNCILGENCIEEIRGRLFDLENCHDQTRNMDYLMKSIGEIWISPNCRETWEKFNDRNWLLHMYDLGMHRMERIYETWGPGKTFDDSSERKIVRETALLFTNQYSGYVHMYCIFDRLVNNGSSLQPAAAMEEGDSLPMARSPKVYIRTFGYFDVFIDGKIFEFTSKKGKELLAILVDRNGGICTTEEAISILWENEPLDSAMTGRYRQVAWRLKKALDEAGIGDIIISKRSGKSVDNSRFDCDLYQFLSGEEKYRTLFHHHYMTNYSWAENTLAILEAIRNG